MDYCNPCWELNHKLDDTKHHERHWINPRVRKLEARRQELIAQLRARNRARKARREVQASHDASAKMWELCWDADGNPYYRHTVTGACAIVPSAWGLVLMAWMVLADESRWEKPHCVAAHEDPEDISSDEEDDGTLQVPWEDCGIRVKLLLLPTAPAPDLPSDASPPCTPQGPASPSQPDSAAAVPTSPGVAALPTTPTTPTTPAPPAASARVEGGASAGSHRSRASAHSKGGDHSPEEAKDAAGDAPVLRPRHQRKVARARARGDVVAVVLDIFDPLMSGEESDGDDADSAGMPAVTADAPGSPAAAPVADAASAGADASPPRASSRRDTGASDAHDGDDEGSAGASPHSAQPKQRRKQRKKMTGKEKRRRKREREARKKAKARKKLVRVSHAPTCYRRAVVPHHRGRYMRACGCVAVADDGTG